MWDLDHIFGRVHVLAHRVLASRLGDGGSDTIVPSAASRMTDFIACPTRHCLRPILLRAWVECHWGSGHCFDYSMDAGNDSELCDILFTDLLVSESCHSDGSAWPC